MSNRYLTHPTDSYFVVENDSGWADGVLVDVGNWQFTTGYTVIDPLNERHSVIYEQKSGYRSEKQSADAMDKSWNKMHKEVLPKE